MTDNNIIPHREPLPNEYESLSRQELKRRLTTYIADLLDADFEKLCNMIYRHDVSEVKFYQALQTSGVKEQAENLSDLVIERELEKVKSRQAYRSEKEEKTKNNLGEAK